jgi:hypothetical protein
MRSMKANASEPLMKGRKPYRWLSEPGSAADLGKSVGECLLSADTAPGLEAARAWTRLEHGTLEPVASMPRERPKRGDRKGMSTDAKHRDGTIRSSAEGPVMGLEPRDRVILFSFNGSTATSGRSL